MKNFYILEHFLWFVISLLDLILWKDFLKLFICEDPIWLPFFFSFFKFVIYAYLHPLSICCQGSNPRPLSCTYVGRQAFTKIMASFVNIFVKVPIQKNGITFGQAISDYNKPMLTLYKLSFLLNKASFRSWEKTT